MFLIGDDKKFCAFPWIAIDNFDEKASLRKAVWVFGSTLQNENQVGNL